jgi:hypothetical protein
MKAAGFIVLAAGCISGAASLYLDTTVGVENQVNGWTQVERVHNIGRMDQRRNLLIASGFIALVGTLFVGFGFLRDTRLPATQVLGIDGQEASRKSRTIHRALTILLAFGVCWMIIGSIIAFCLSLSGSR